MKKIAVMLLALIICATLSACTSSVAKTEALIRWQGNEDFTFDITKADLDYTKSSSSTTYTKYPLGTYEYNVAAKDELVPDDVSGIYTFKILKSDSQFTLETNQILFLQYKKSDLEAVGVNLSDDDWKALTFNFTDDEDYAECSHKIENKDDCVVLKSTNFSTVVFENVAAQTPVSSTNVVKGFYIGKTHSETNDVDVATSYDWNNKTITVTDNKTQTSETISANASLIDANQLLLYVRSLDKSSGKFQDSPSVKVFSAVSKQTYTASFSQFTYSCRTYIVDSDGNNVAAILNLVGVAVNNSTVLVQLNAPDTVNTNSAVDQLQSGVANTLNKYTTVRFRSGVLNYELQLNKYPEGLFDALKATASE